MAGQHIESLTLAIDSINRGSPLAHTPAVYIPPPSP